MGRVSRRHRELIREMDRETGKRLAGAIHELTKALAKVAERDAILAAERQTTSDAIQGSGDGDQANG